MREITSKQIFLICFIWSSILLVSGYVLQYKFFVEPCPLCLLQRALYFVVGLFFLFACICPLKIMKLCICSSISLIASALGAALASRQIWLQNLPDYLKAECLPGLDWLLENYSVFESIKIVIQNAGECGKVSFTILGLSLAHWSLLNFIAFIVVCLYLLKKRWV